jgi:hypothetical protein
MRTNVLCGASLLCVGLTWDSCVYHLVNHPPADPHPHPADAWHVDVCFGNAVREYTPVSTVADWQQGRLDLLVKTYGHGAVSGKFAMLRAASTYTPLEEQACWALCSAPRLTLALPAMPRPLPQPGGPGLQRRSPGKACSDEPGPLDQLAPAVAAIGLVVGGTGVAPALQVRPIHGSQEPFRAANPRSELL